MNKFIIKSFCKINLSLSVLKKNHNGYHSISSLVTFCDLHDLLLIQKIKGTKDKVIFSGKFKKNINNKKNTLTKLLKILRKKNLFKGDAFKINVIKNIPHGAGLGGGSSNAAALLNFLNQNMKLKYRKEQITKIARQIGFDVPIVLKKQNTFLTGNNEKIKRLKKSFNLNILIVYPNIVCSTKKIYQKNKTFSFLKSNFYNLFKNKNKLIMYLKKQNNDLEQSVIKFHPRVGSLINFIKIQNGCCFSRITGSGSACIGIFSKMEDAIYAQKQLNLKYKKYWSVVSKTI